MVATATYMRSGLVRGTGGTMDCRLCRPTASCQPARQPARAERSIRHPMLAASGTTRSAAPVQQQQIDNAWRWPGGSTEADAVTAEMAAFLREDLQHLFDDQGIDQSRYDEARDTGHICRRCHSMKQIIECVVYLGACATFYASCRRRWSCSRTQSRAMPVCLATCSISPCCATCLLPPSSCTTSVARASGEFVVPLGCARCALTRAACNWPCAGR